MKKYLIGAGLALLTILATVLVVGFTWKPALAGPIYRLEWDDGGRIEPYLARAAGWKRNNALLVIVDAQVSAAGLAILEARRLGVRMCYKKELFADPSLYLHQVKRGTPSGKWKFTDETKKYGFPSPINGYRKVIMKELGIKPCSKKYKPDITLPLRINWR